MKPVHGERVYQVCIYHMYSRCLGYIILLHIIHTRYTCMYVEYIYNVAHYTHFNYFACHN